MGLEKCEDTIHGHWKMGDAPREEDGREQRMNTTHIRGMLLHLLFILFDINCKSVQVVFRHMVGGMDRFVGYLLGLLRS